MGIDIPDIQRVIQWRLSTRVNMSTIYQRIGRAAWRSGVQGIGILFHSPLAIVTPAHTPEAQIYKRAWNDPDTAIMRISCRQLWGIS